MNVEWFVKNESFIWLVLVCLCCHHYGAVNASGGMGWSMGKPAFTKDARNEMTQSEEADLRLVKNEFYKKKKGLTINNFMSEMGVNMPQEIVQNVDVPPESSSEESGSESGSFEYYYSDEEDSSEDARNSTGLPNNSSVIANPENLTASDNQTASKQLADNLIVEGNHTTKGTDNDMRSNTTNHSERLPNTYHENAAPGNQQSPDGEAPVYDEPEEREEEYPDQAAKEEEDQEDQKPDEVQQSDKDGEGEVVKKRKYVPKPKFGGKPKFKPKPGRRLKKRLRRKKKKPPGQERSPSKPRKHRTRKILQFQATTLGTSLTDSGNSNGVSNGPTFNGKDISTDKYKNGGFSKQSIGKSTLSFHKHKRFRTTGIKSKPFGSTRSGHVHSIGHRPKGPGYQNVEKSESTKTRTSVSETTSDSQKSERKKSDIPSQNTNGQSSRSLNVEKSTRRVESSQSSSSKKDSRNGEKPKEKNQKTKYEKQTIKMEGLEINYTRKQGAGTMSQLPMLYEQR